MESLQHIGVQLGILAGIVISLAVISKLVLWTYNAIDQTRSAFEHSQLVPTIEKKLDIVIAEFSPDSGHSLKDQIQRVEIRIAKIEGRLQIESEEVPPAAPVDSVHLHRRKTD